MMGGGAKAQLSSKPKPQAQQKRAPPRKEPVAHEPKDTLIVMLGTEFLYLDYVQDTWAIGDVVSIDGSQMEIAENCSIVTLDQSVSKTTRMIVTGGVLKQGSILNWAFGMGFRMDGDTMQTNMSLSDPNMIMPEQRMMHQSCIVTNSDGNPRLLVFGGKTGQNPLNSTFTSSVIGFDLHETLAGQPSTKSWVKLADMSCARASFGHMVVDNQVYAYGGIHAGGKGDSSHYPLMATQICERYDPIGDKWESIDIKNSMPLGSFGFTPISETSMLILGGSDGEMLQEACFVVDFKTGEAKMQAHSMESQTAMSKVVYRK